MLHRLLTILFFLASLGAQSQHYVERDLRPEWKHYKNGQYASVKVEDEQPVYFLVNKHEVPGQLLQIEGKTDITIFINHKLTSRVNRRVLLSVDSLAKIYSNQLLIAAQSDRPFTTKLLRLSPTDSEQLELRKSADFKDFVILISLVLIVFMTGLIYANPKLTYDYFNVIKFLSLQEREESLTAIRTTSSINFVYYFFCSLLTSFLMMALFHQSGHTTKFNLFVATPLSMALVNLLKLTLITFAIMMTKLIGVSTLARLFNIREVASFQYFNFVRMTLMATAFMALFSGLYFMLGVTTAELFFWILIIGFAIISFGTALLFLKLLPRTNFQFFHLFSYLCASEIIPLMILIKVLFK